MLLLLAAAMAACGGDKPTQGDSQPVIIEPGLSQPAEGVAAETEEPLPEQNPDDKFTDLGRASTLDDLMDNKAKITSYYYEQTISYSGGDIHIKTWYYDGMMKIESSYPGAPPTVDYYDCYDHSLVSHTPALGKNAVMITYEEGDPELPDNPLAYNYHEYRVLETGSIDGQICRVLERGNGDKIWVGTKYGLPLQVEFTDTLTEEHFIVIYENIAIDQVTEQDVLMPEDLVIYEMIGGMGY